MNKPKQKYRIKNWKEYNAALVNRGSLCIWVSEDVLDAWRAEKETGKNGSPRLYSDIAIISCLTLKKLFHLPLRAIEGFVSSLFRRTSASLPTPNYSTLSRRAETLSVVLLKTVKPKRKGGGEKEKTHLIIDSTGVKVYGEGEWKVRQHGASKRRKWLKIHIGIDETGEIRVAEVTENNVHDGEVAKKLLDQEEANLDAFAADGAYDHSKIYDALTERGISTILIPPRKDAKIWWHGNHKATPHPRDENLRAIRKTTRKRWKESSGYHIRSLVEMLMFRYKTIFTDKISARTWNRQVTEIMLALSALNKMWWLGKPDSYLVTS